ncbi:hypothetical protein PFISCL1PPCAC_18748 [Pristionchus fissidentatus]|uniref:Tyrosine--tRNA ligase n=1 Tax=Pristionchus fissidentatus TaxID=1538716 RepID=A0AAV5W5L0_9BILA|nr:hypothetical protein PFISCL1PPCAC_18748 [Pristionchus fissidentatus]
MATTREQELSAASAQVFDASAELARLERLLDKLERGVVDEEVLEACPDLAEVKTRNDKLAYRRTILQRSLDERLASNAAAAAAAPKKQPESKMSAGDAAKAAPEAPSEEVLKRRDLITRNLQEVLGGDKLLQQLTAGKNMHVYWGTATTGRPHVGYLVPMRKIADFLQAGIKVTILFADLHAFLDNMKSTWELLENRVKYYEASIKALLQALDVPIEQLHFRMGSHYQLGRPFTEDMIRLCTQVSQRDALKAGAEVVKQVDSPLLSGLLYPLLQALDEQHLKVDGQFGGVDQRKIFILAEEQLPKLKLGKRWHLMNPMVPGLTGGKMSSSEIDSKIDLLDPAELVTRKIASAVCERGADENGVLSFYQFVLLPIVAPADVQIGGKSFSTLDSIKAAFEEGAIQADDLKETLTEFLNTLLGKVQAQCDTPEMKEVLLKGYATVEERKTSLPDRPTVSLDATCTQHLEALIGGAKLVGEGTESLQAALTTKKPVKVLISLAPKGRFHLGMVAPLLQIRKAIRAGVPVEATVLISSLEALLDSEKCPWNAREPRAAYYAAVLEVIVEHLGIASAVKIQKDFDLPWYLSNDYALDLYKLASAVTRDESALLNTTSSALSCNLVPLVYALNAKYTETDVIVVGEDTTSTAQLAVKLLHAIGSHAPTQLAVEIVPGMDENKMSCSSLDFLLDPLDTPKQTKTKIARSFCEPLNTERNVALELARKVVFPLMDGNALLITRAGDNGGDVSCASHDDLVKEFSVGSNPAFPLHPADLKTAVVNQINPFFDVVRAKVPDQAKLLAAAFPKVQGKKK